MGIKSSLRLLILTRIRLCRQLFKREHAIAIETGNKSTKTETVIKFHEGYRKAS